MEFNRENLLRALEALESGLKMEVNTMKRVKAFLRLMAIGLNEAQKQLLLF